MTTDKAVAEMTLNPNTLGDLRKFVKLLDRMSLPDTTLVSVLGVITVRSWMDQFVVPRGRGVS